MVSIIQMSSMIGLLLTNGLERCEGTCRILIF